MDTTTGPKKGCPRCNEIPSASSVTCEYCGFPLNQPGAAGGTGTSAIPGDMEVPVWHLRLGCHMLDTMLMWFVLLVVLVPSAVMQRFELVALAYLGIMAWWVTRDAFPRGGSPGKRVGGVRVIDATTGEPCTFFQALGRQLVMMIPLVNLIEMILVLLGENRMGDRMVGTRVVRPRSLGPQPRWGLFLVLLGFILPAAAGVLAAIAVPNFAAARERANTRACFANQKTVLGALEMYRLDKNKKPEETPELTAELFGELKSGGYLQSIPTDPGQGLGTSGNYYLTGETHDAIACRVHGSFDGKVPAGQRRRRIR